MNIFSNEKNYGKRTRVKKEFDVRRRVIVVRKLKKIIDRLFVSDEQSKRTWQMLQMTSDVRKVQNGDELRVRQN